MQAFIDTFFSVKFFPSLFIANLLFAWHLPKRGRFALRFVCSSVLCISFSVALWWLLRRSHQLSAGRFGFVACNVVYFFEIIAFTCFNFRCTFFEGVLYNVSGWSVEHLSNAFSYIFAILLNVQKNNYEYNLEFFLLTLFTYLIVYLAAGIVYWRLRKNGSVRLNNKKVVVPSMLLMITVILLNIYTPYDSMTAVAQLFTRLYACACCLTSLCAMFGLFESGQYRFELDMLDQINRKKQEQYEISKETIEAINVKCHDLKKMISSALGGKNILTPEELKSLEERIGIYDAIVKTGNEALDLILTEKSLYCERNAIRLTLMVDAESFGFLSNAEIYALFGNILDNAVEAVLKVEAQKRVISLCVKRVGSMLSIHEDNFFGGVLQYKGENLATSKRNAVDHGFGIISIRRIVEKYGGGMTIGTEGDIFSLDILIPLGA